jgi:hypothetical protein
MACFFRGFEFVRIFSSSICWASFRQLRFEKIDQSPFRSPIAMGVAERTEIEIVVDTKVRRAHSGDRIAVPLTITFLRPSLALAGRRSVELCLD